MKGVNVLITVWDSDQENLFVPFDMVDEFNFNYMAPAGQVSYDCYDGIRNRPKSRFVRSSAATLLIIAHKL